MTRFHGPMKFRPPRGDARARRCAECGQIHYGEECSGINELYGEAWEARETEDLMREVEEALGFRLEVAE